MASVSEADNKRARQSVLDAAKADLQEASWSLAAWVSGSIATGNADAWADIDLRIVVVPDHYESILARRYEIPRTWGNVAFEEEVPRDNLAILHFRPFFKVDIFYYRPTDLAPSTYLLLPQMILHDPDGILADVVSRSEELPPDANQQSLSYLKTRAVAAAGEVRRKLLRNELLYAQAYLLELREWIVQIHQYKTGADRHQAPLQYAEQVAPKDFRRALLAYDHGMSKEGLEAAMRDLGAIAQDLLDDKDRQLRSALDVAVNW